MKLKELHESIEQQRTVVDPNQIENDKTYIHTSNGDESVVWGPFAPEEAQGFLSHSGLDQKSNITADIMSGRDIIQRDILSEVDIGDYQLARQHQKQQDTNTHDKVARNSFKDKMAANNPNRGDVVIVNATKFIVVGNDREGVLVKQIGGPETSSIPHGTKFKNMGVSPKSGKTIFKAMK